MNRLYLILYIIQSWDLESDLWDLESDPGSGPWIRPQTGPEIGPQESHILDILVLRALY